MSPSFESITISNRPLTPPPDGALFWPPTRSRLLLLFEPLADASIIARVVDADAADGTLLVVFRVNLQLDQKDRLVKAVRDGIEPTPVPSNENVQRTEPTQKAARPSAPDKRSAPTKPPAPGKWSAPGDRSADGDAVVIGDDPGNGTGHRFYSLVLPPLDATVLSTGTQG